MATTRKRVRHDTIKVVERKLGRMGKWGWYGCFQHATKTVVLDPRLKPRKHIEILIHEVLHYCCPDWSETKVTHTARVIAGVMWQMGYRRVNLK